jgi:capsular exopolysaccharide synthesis family protein
MQDAIVALVAALFGGLIVAFFFEFIDNRIKTPDEIRTRLRLPFLGLLPAVTVKGAVSGRAMLDNLPVNFLEACRHVRSGVLFSTGEEAAQSVLVTSTAPGEGKTFVASNLAISLARAGSRVLLIDADMRRPTVHTQFDEPQEPGLSNVITGNMQPSQAIIKTSIQDLWVLPAGRTPPNPAELLGSKRFQLFLESIQEQFTWVVIDSPPLMAVTDAMMVARIVRGVLFVVGADMTSRQAAQQALERLTAARATVWGAVLNRANVAGHGYYYSKYYNRSYESYYSQAL